jgi:hypothetical protein
MALGDDVDEIVRREVKSLPAYAKAQAAGGSGLAPPVDEPDARVDVPDGRDSPALGPLRPQLH